MNKLLITRRGEKILTALWDGERVAEFRAEEEDPPLTVGDIYLAKVRNIVKNINAAFVEVQPGLLCFLPLTKQKKLVSGEEILVQVTREAVKTKAPTVSDGISLPGNLLVLVDDKPQIAISAKIREAKRRETLKNLLADYPGQGLGFIVRTNGENAPDDKILAEAEALAARYPRLRGEAAHRPCHTRLFAGQPAYLAAIRDVRRGLLGAVVTDEKDIYERLAEEPDLPVSPQQLQFYQDPSLSLSSLYRLEHFLEMALSRRVWLKSGGYLVIEPTEALTVIDVNTGKFDGRKDPEETFFKINLEAAREIAFQARLRNLSGILLVDFIDMAEPEHRSRLAAVLKEALAEDSVKTVFVDFTSLGLAELTRKKVRKPLAEEMRISGVSGERKKKK